MAFGPSKNTFTAFDSRQKAQRKVENNITRLRALCLSFWAGQQNSRHECELDSFQTFDKHILFLKLEHALIWREGKERWEKTRVFIHPHR